MIYKILSFLAISFCTLLIIWLAGAVLFTISVVGAKPERIAMPTDALVVVTGGKGRIYQALDLLAEEKAPTLFISGVNKDVSEKDIIAKWKQARGNVAKTPCCVELGYKAEDTLGNAQEIHDWVMDNKVNTIRLITSNYHMPRTYMEVKKHLSDDVLIYRHPLSYPQDKLLEKDFLLLIFSEYNKILLSWPRLEQAT